MPKKLDRRYFSE